MQLRKMTLMLAALGAMSMVLTGCPDGGRENLVCAENGDCLENEVCHPTAKVCVQTCSIGADCPSSTRRCEEIGGGNTTKVCKCDATANCAADDRIDAELICNTTAGVNVCVTACTTDTDCGTGQTCDVATGFCKGSGTGGGTGTSCDPATQPGICGYGQVCSAATSKCEAAPVGTCTAATAAGAPTWNTSTSSAPVIVSASARLLSSTNASNECAGGAAAALVTIKYYAPGGLTTHSDLRDLQNHVKFRVATDFFGVNFSRADPPTGGATQGTMEVGIACGSSRREAAIYIANEAGTTSNVVCVSW